MIFKFQKRKGKGLMTSADVIHGQILSAEHKLLEFEQMERIPLRQSLEEIEADRTVAAPPGNGHRRRHTARRSGGRRRRSAAGLTRGTWRERRARGGPQEPPGARGSVGEARGARGWPEIVVDGGGPAEEIDQFLRLRGFLA